VPFVVRGLIVCTERRLIVCTERRVGQAFGFDHLWLTARLRGCRVWLPTAGSCPPIDGAICGAGAYRVH
jgi:hypothetical protein